MTKVAILDKLKKMKCISQMGEEYLDIWTDLAKKYGARLDQDNIIKRVAYTNHDFTHHCKDIYVIIETVFFQNIQLTEEEYFVLAVSVLLHDISMTKENFDRLCHSQQSADYVDSEINAGVDEWKKVPTQHIPVIKDIIRAHSDIKEKDKNGKENIKRNTLQETAIIQSGDCGANIHVRWLAGVLRIADELDITNARLGTAENRYMNLDISDEEQLYSRQCWEQLNYFCNVKREKTNIILELNEDYLKKHINDDRYNIIEQIKIIKRNIRKKLTEVNELAFDNDDEYVTYIKLRDVNLEDKGKIFQEWELDDDLGKETSSEEKETVIGPLKEGGKEKEKQKENQKLEKEEDLGQINQLRETLGKRITDYIYDNGLIHYGHYRLNRLVCGKDWINVREILSDPMLGQQCIDVISNDLELIMEKKGLVSSKVMAVGVGMNGNIMASRVAFRLGIPFTYIVPQKPGLKGSEMERAFNAPPDSKIIIFTGVVSSMDTLKSVLNNELKNMDVFRIYTILMRSPSTRKNDEDLSYIKSKLICLNTDFTCEIIPKNQCMNVIHGRCIAQNIQAYEEVFEWPLATKDQESKRIFINNIIGCDAGCNYCYLPSVGIQKKCAYTFEEVKAEFERLNDVSPDKYIISIGCYAECMLNENLKYMTQIVTYFAEKKYYIQISTKKKIDIEWLIDIEEKLKFTNQLNIYVSIPTMSQANVVEPNADSVEDRIQNFCYKTTHERIKMYLYIKPYLESITAKDKEQYLGLVQKYDLEVIVGAKFQYKFNDLSHVKVGINDMYEIPSVEKENFIRELEKKTKVYRHSVEPIELIEEPRV